MGDWHRIADDVAGMRFIPNVRGSRYSNNAIAMREALKDYVNGKIGSAEWQQNHVRRTQKLRKLKTRHLM